MSGEQEEDSRAELRRWLTSYDDFDDANKKTDHQTSAQMASESCRGKLKAARQRPRRCKVVNHFDNFNKAGRCYSSAICNHYHQVSRIIMSATFLPLIVVALFVCLVGCVPGELLSPVGVKYIAPLMLLRYCAKRIRVILFVSRAQNISRASRCAQGIPFVGL